MAFFTEREPDSGNELHLSIHFETMRRCAFELMGGSCLLQKYQKIGKDGKKFEPFEQFRVEITEQCTGTVVDMMTERRDEKAEHGRGEF